MSEQVLQALNPDDWSEEIHAEKAVIRFPNGVLSGGWQSQEDEGKTKPYLRRDLSLAHVAVMLEKAAEAAKAASEHTKHLTRQGEPDRYARGLYEGIVECQEEARRAIRALIGTDAQAALDAHVQRAVEKERERIADIQPDGIELPWDEWTDGQCGAAMIALSRFAAALKGGSVL